LCLVFILKIYHYTACTSLFLKGTVCHTRKKTSSHLGTLCLSPSTPIRRAFHQAEQAHPTLKSYRDSQGVIYFVGCSIKKSFVILRDLPCIKQTLLKFTQTISLLTVRKQAQMQSSIKAQCHLYAGNFKQGSIAALDSGTCAYHHCQAHDSKHQLPF